MAQITIEKVGRRFYLRGNTYAVKDQIRNAGGHWDADQKSWWVSKANVAEQLAGATGGSAPEGARSGSGGDGERAAPGKEAIVAGRAKYKGRAYYLAGRVERGRTHWDDRVETITTRDGAKTLLYFRDGSKSFWAPRNEVQVVKSYQKGATIEKLERLSEEWKKNGGQRAPGRRYECEECGEWVTAGEGSCWETGAAH